MNEKLTLQDLVDLLAIKKGVTKKDAELFLKELISVVTETIYGKESVKIKDFGTFKLTPVSRRESVDVNTGEKIEIPAHFRLSFQPDKILKEIVNKPFASFESILLDDDEGRGTSSFEDPKSVDAEMDDEILDEDEDILVEEQTTEEAVIPVVVQSEVVKNQDLKTDDPLLDEGLIKSNLSLKRDSKEVIVRPDIIPITPHFEYSYSTTIGTSDRNIKEFDTIRERNENTPIGKEEEKIVFQETLSNDLKFSAGDIPKESNQPDLLSEESLLSRNLILEEDEKIIELDSIEGENPEEDSVVNVDEQEEEETPDFYPYKPSFWASFWRRLPLILFVLIVLGVLTYAFLKLFDIKYENDFFGKKTFSTYADSSSVNKHEKNNAVILDSVAGETSKRLDSLRLQMKYDNSESVYLEEHIPNVNKAEKKLISEQKLIDTTSDPLAKETIKKGTTLRLLSSRYYGQAVFWVYIYEENKNVIDDPDNVPLGLKVNVPRPEKYDIDAKDIKSLDRAKDKEQEIIRKARQKRFQQASSEQGN